MASTGIDLCQFPALAPPDGVVPNFVDPPDLTAATFAIGIIFIILPAILTAARIHLNWGNLKAPDYLATLGFCINTAFNIIIMNLHGFSRHQWDIPACWFFGDTGAQTTKMLFASNLITGPTQFVLKLSILLLYFQIFAVTRRMRYAIYFGVLLSVGIYWPHIVITIVWSTPRAGETWADLATNGRPHNMVAYAPALGLGDVAIDVYIFILPIVALRGLKVSASKRWQVMGVFMTALLGIVGSCLACYWRLEIWRDSQDQTWLEALIFLGTMVELGAAAIIASMPAFASVVRTYARDSGFARLLSLATSRKTSKGTWGTGGLDGPSKESQPPTIGRAGGRRVRNYWELDDSLFNTQATALDTLVGGPEAGDQPPATHTERDRGIVKTVRLTQESEFSRTPV